MIPHRSLSRSSSENGVSSRVGACRKRFRTIRAEQKARIETVEPVAGVSGIYDAVDRTEISQSLGIIAGRAERLEDEAGTT